MFTRFVATSAAIYAAISLVAATGAVAQEAPNSGAVYGAKTVGALYYETKDLTVSAPAAPLQVGATTAATVRWLPVSPEIASVYGEGAVGALVRETNGLATSADAVARQGGAATAGAVRWVSGPQG